ncbi:MAG: Gfo/Idh/MocA family oxidoreductase, partial [Myxococcales bacterium]
MGRHGGTSGAHHAPKASECQRHSPLPGRGVAAWGDESRTPAANRHPRFGAGRADGSRAPRAGAAGGRGVGGGRPRSAEGPSLRREASHPRVFDSYDELLACPEIDAVYNPLPNGLHCEWTIRALEAGKHVLCEKPMASNASEAERMAEAARKAGRVLVEAFHWRYHPLAERMREVVRTRLGEVEHLEAWLCIPFLLPGDIRFRYELGGGATMDTGCYAINVVRWLAEAEP